MILEKSKNKIVILKDPDFDIPQTLECGQVFSFVKVGENCYIVISNNKIATVTYDNEKIIIESDDINYFYNYFDLDTDYTNIKNGILKINPEVSKYMGYGGGIRILKQDIYQTIISFIVSANNNIKRIKSILFKISKLYGTKIGEYAINTTTSLPVTLESGLINSSENASTKTSAESMSNKTKANKTETDKIEIYSFPTIQQLSGATAETFSKLGAGYRSEYLVKSIAMLGLPEYSIENLQKLPTSELKMKLTNLAGVGPKVADCILLFGFSRTDVFPIDTWTRKCYYLFETNEKSDKEIAKYFVNKYKNYAGFAQQYLYNYMLNHSTKNE